MLSFRTRLAKTNFNFVPPVSGSVSVNSTPTSNAASAVSSLTFSHTVNSGSKRMLLVPVSINGSHINTITYNSVGLTLIGYYTVGSARSELWYLLNPDVGTYNVAITINDGNTYIEAGAVTFNGVNQSTPYSGLNSINATSINISSRANSIVVALLTYWAGSPATIGSGQTSLWNVTSDTAWRGVASYKAGTSTTNMYYTTASSYIAIIGVSIDP